MNTIHWAFIARHAVWILGLAIVLAVWSYADWQAHSRQIRRRTAGYPAGVESAMRWLGIVLYRHGPGQWINLAKRGLERRWAAPGRASGVVLARPTRNAALIVEVKRKPDRVGLAAQSRCGEKKTMMSQRMSILVGVLLLIAGVLVLLLNFEPSARWEIRFGPCCSLAAGWRSWSCT